MVACLFPRSPSSRDDSISLHPNWFTNKLHIGLALRKSRLNSPIAVLLPTAAGQAGDLNDAQDTNPISLDH